MDSLIFTAENVIRVREGLKIHTRRLIEPQPPQVEDVKRISGAPFSIVTRAPGAPELFVPVGPVWAVRELCGCTLWKCPYGSPGSVLWIRENYRLDEAFDDLSPNEARAFVQKRGHDLNIRYEADGESVRRGPPTKSWGKLRPSIHMGRWGTRLRIQLTETLAEPLQSISETDILREGIEEGEHHMQTRQRFAALWDSIHSAHAWAKNPWVWVLAFEVV